MIAGVREVEQVARRTGIPLPDDAVDRIVRYCDALPAAMRPSMFIDITAGKPLEVEALPVFGTRETHQLASLSFQRLHQFDMLPRVRVPLRDQ